MRADLGALFHNHDGNVGRDLLQPDRGGEPGGPAPTITTSNSMDSRAGSSVGHGDAVSDMSVAPI